MAFDLTSLRSAISTLKSNISDSYKACADKGATSIPTTKNSANLPACIRSIPTGSGSTISESIVGGSFSGFAVTLEQAYEDSDGNLVLPKNITLNMGSVGVTFKSLVCYSASNDGYFMITKIANNKCIISSHVFNKYDQEEIYGVIDVNGSAHTYLASYQISGNSIKFVYEQYPNANFVGSDDSDYFRGVADQVATNDWGYFSSYPLELITVCA